MQALHLLLDGYARRTDARWWIGARPDVCVERMAATIARQVGLPLPASKSLAACDLIGLNRPQAAHVLAVAGTTSLAYERPRPRLAALEAARLALADLGDGATFLSNGRWDDADRNGWMPLTAATFDGGVIGYDAASAFIFWVEEED